ncbi:MAG: sugar ABC transporter substrate-binding protein [Acidimicrobiales bacterium]
MRRWFRLIAVLLALVVVAAACGDSSGDGDGASTTSEAASGGGEGGGKIAVLLPDSASSARWENDDRRFFEEAFADAGLSSDEYIISNAEGDAATMQTQAEQAITDGATVLLMVNLDSGSGAAIIDNARSQGVAVIDYDRLTIEGPGADYYVSFDNVAVGATMGAAMEAALADFDGVPNVMILDGGPTDNNATLFAEGYMGFAQPHFDDGSWNLVDRQAVPDWDNTQAQVLAEQILTAAGNEVDAAIVANDGMAGGVIAALAAQGINGIPVTGQDATVGGVQNILLGDQLMTVYKAIKAEAFAAADLAVALSRGEEPSGVTGAVNNGTNDVPSVLLVPVETNASNINETVIADGFRTAEEICVGDVAASDFCAG